MLHGRVKDLDLYITRAILQISASLAVSTPMQVSTNMSTYVQYVLYYIYETCLIHARTRVYVVFVCYVYM